MKHKNRPKLPTSLNSRRWVFVRKGLDDFRRGCPPCHGLITRGPEQDFLPWIHHRAPQPAPKRRQNKPPKDAALFSKLSPAQRARQAFLEDVEARLASHPLAGSRSLEEAMPAELLLKVLEVLDPDRKLEDTWAYCEDPRKRTKEHPELSRKSSTQVHLGLHGPPRDALLLAGPALSRHVRTQPSRPREHDRASSASAPDYLLPAVAHQINPWIKEGSQAHPPCALSSRPVILFQGSSNIDAEFILAQFDLDYQDRPGHDVLPTLRPNPVPLELKPRLGLSKQQELEFFQKLDYERKLQKPQNPHKPKTVKMRYGAWYLDTKLWKKQRADEPLVDPKVSHKAPDENFKKGLQEQEQFLADLHGTVAFKDFILSRGYRMPSFLEKMRPRKECERACKSVMSVPLRMFIFDLAASAHVVHDTCKHFSMTFCFNESVFYTFYQL
ncbi:PREDICTED: protein FAM47E [Propithecus coquereli]|uniref:protein FAM47E n=1 Tax=Propithecus coquereli TaxID=379532 RepID=UPI00063FA989|nr:PREDICTED: protein FAM47E [Propithecus coquereli]